MSLSIQPKDFYRESQQANPPIPQKIINHQKYEITIHNSSLKERLICDCTRDGITKKNIPIVIAKDYDNRPIRSNNLTYYPDFNTFVLGNYGLKGGMVREIDVGRLIREKLDNPNRPFSSEESIAVLMECMRQGEIEAAKGVKKEITIFIGNTGSGKSTLVNYLYGCDMERIPCKTALQGKAVAVKPQAKGGKYDPIMKIGHTKKSETFMPQIAEDPGQQITYCDCPGFLDNRGIEINVANAVNIRKALIQAKNVKVVMLINYHSLLSDRGKGLKDMIAIACDLFGTKENLIKYKESILLGITQVPICNDDPSQIEDLKEWIKKADTRDPFEKNVIDVLSERIFIYDPLERNLDYPILRRQELIKKIQALNSVAHPRNIFKTVLSIEEQSGLVEISEKIGREIRNHLQERDFGKVKEYITSLEQLEIIEHPGITRLVTCNRNLIVQHFKDMILRFDRLVANSTDQLSREAEGIVNKVKEGIRYFDNQIQSQVDVSGLEKRFEAIKQIAIIKKTKEEYDSFIAQEQFARAQEKLNELKVKEKEFVKKYEATGLKISLNINQLEHNLNRAKQNYEAKEQAKETARLEAAAAQKARAEAAAEQEQRVRAEKAEKAAREQQEQRVQEQQEQRVRAEKAAREQQIRAEKAEKAEQEQRVRAEKAEKQRRIDGLRHNVIRETMKGGDLRNALHLAYDYNQKRGDRGNRSCGIAKKGYQDRLQCDERIDAGNYTIFVGISSGNLRCAHRGWDGWAFSGKQTHKENYMCF